MRVILKSSQAAFACHAEYDAAERRTYFIFGASQDGQGEPPWALIRERWGRSRLSETRAESSRHSEKAKSIR